MSAVTGISCQFLSLAVGLRSALADYEACERVSRSTIVDTVEVPRARAINVVLLNVALCEATINHVLALHLSAQSRNSVARYSTWRKGTEVP